MYQEFNKRRPRPKLVIKSFFCLMGVAIVQRYLFEEHFIAQVYGRWPTIGHLCPRCDFFLFDYVEAENRTEYA